MNNKIKIRKKKEKNNVDLKISIIYILIFISLIILFTPQWILKDARITGEVSAVVRILGIYPPVFDFVIGDQKVNQTDNFTLQVNCSDQDLGSQLEYYDNFTGFEINKTTGVINQSGFDQSLIGNNTIQIICRDQEGYNATQNFNLEIIDVNEPPVLEPIGNKIATEGEEFSFFLYATDPDYNNELFGNLTFGDSTTLFEVKTLNNSPNGAIGLVNFTPAYAQIGNITVNMSVFDGFLYDYEIIIITVVRGPYCGDGSCIGLETCENCEVDCGACPPPEESGEGAVGIEQPQSDIPPGRAPYYRCQEKWECSEWSVCSIEEIRTRKCIDVNNCGTAKQKPREVEDCEYIPTCFDGIKNGKEDGVDCGGDCPPCLIANCFDGILNCHDGSCEEDVDCGGPCEPCKPEEIKKPVIEQPTRIEVSKWFPWMLLILIMILLSSMITGDQVYVRKIKRKELEVFKEEFNKYRPIRRKLYKFILNTAIITLMASFYIYYFSDNINKMIAYSWIPGLVSITIPFIVTIIIRNFEYYEYKKKVKERKLNERHRRELLQLIKLENNLLYTAESDIKKKISAMAKERKFDSYPALYSFIKEIYKTLGSLSIKRKKRREKLKISAEAADKILSLLDDKTMLQAAKEYPEFKSILNNLKYIIDNRDLDTADKENDFLEDIREISQPYMKSVILSDKALISLYNKFVDIYEYYMNKNKEVRMIDNEIMELEREFTEKVKDMSKKPVVIDNVQKDPKIISLYNLNVDLFNHYTRKLQLSKSLQDLHASSMTKPI